MQSALSQSSPPDSREGSLIRIEKALPAWPLWSAVNDAWLFFSFSLLEGTTRSRGKKLLLDFTLELEGAIIASVPPQMLEYEQEFLSVLSLLYPQQLRQ